MSRTQDDLPRWEGIAVAPSADSEVETTMPLAPESSDSEDSDEPTVIDLDADLASADADADADVDAASAEPPVDEVEIAAPDRDEPTTVEVDFDGGGLLDDPDAGRARRRQALFGLLAACLTFGVALLLTGVIGDDGDGSDGDGSGDDVVTVDTTGPEPDLDEGSGSDEDADRSGPVLSVDSEGSEAAGPTTVVGGGGEDGEAGAAERSGEGLGQAEAENSGAVVATADADDDAGTEAGAGTSTDGTAAADDDAGVGSGTSGGSSETGPTTTVAAGSSPTTVAPGAAGAGSSPGRIVREWNSDRNHESIATAAGEPSWAVFEDFELVLRGEVPSDDVLDEVRTRIENVVGPASVVGDYEVVPGTPPPTDPPLFVLSGVEFEDDGTTIAPASRTFLQLAFVLMLRYPQTEITVVHHSYPVRGSLIDEDVALAEGQAVVDFLTDLGVDSDRLSVESVAYNDRAAAQGDIDDDRDGRWIDFVVRGLLEDS